MYSTIRQSPETFEKRSLLQELDFLRTRCTELETDNNLLKDEQASLHKRTHDVITNDNTIDNYIRDNTQLHLDVDRLSKLSRQRKTDADLWKSKYENQMQQILQIKSNYEYEIRQLNAELQKMGALLNQSELERQRQVVGIAGQLESQANSEYENLKKASNLQIEISESQIRKLRDHIEEQNNEVSELQAKLLRQKAEDDTQIERLFKENELLRIRSSQQDGEKQRELEQLNDNLNSYTVQQIDVLKLEFARQSDLMQSEIDKLRGLLEIKNAEIETLMQQNQKNKLLFEDQIDSLRQEIQALRNKLLEQERQARVNQETLLSELTITHHNDTETLKQYYEQQLNNLDKEIINLKGVIDEKGRQIQIVMEEKSLLRVQMESMINELRRELENSKIQNAELERGKNNEINELDDQFQKAQALAYEQIDLQKAQIIFLEGEVSNLKELQLQKLKELDSHIGQFNMLKRTYEDDVRRLKDELHIQNSELLQLTSAKNSEIQDLVQKVDRSTANYRDKLRQNEIQIEQQHLEIKRLRETIAVREQEMDNIMNQKMLMEKDYRRGRDEIEQLKSKIIGIEKEKFQQLEELKNKLEGSNQYQISNLKTAFNTQITVLGEENQQLKQQIEARRVYDQRA